MMEMMTEEFLWNYRQMISGCQASGDDSNSRYYEGCCVSYLEMMFKIQGIEFAGSTATGIMGEELFMACYGETSSHLVV